MMDGSTFLALSAIGGFGQCPNARLSGPNCSPYGGVTLYPPRAKPETCPHCGATIVYPPSDITRLGVIAATGEDPGPTNHRVEGAEGA